MELVYSGLCCTAQGGFPVNLRGVDGWWEPGKIRRGRGKGAEKTFRNLRETGPWVDVKMRIRPWTKKGTCRKSGNPSTVFTSYRSWNVVTYVPVKSKLKHPPGQPPRQPPGHLIFWKIFVQIPPSGGRKTVQMPHYRFIPGDQMPPPPGNFSVASIMLRKVCM